MINYKHLHHSPKHCLLILALLGILQSNVLVHLELVFGGILFVSEMVDLNDANSEKKQSEKDVEEEEKEEKKRLELLNARLVNLTNLLIHDHLFLEFTTIHHLDIVTPPPEEIIG